MSKTLPDFRAVPIAYKLTYGEVMDPQAYIGAMDMELLEAWTRLRKAVNSPIRVNSGFRTREYNKKIGGSPTSKHLVGQALDIQSTRYDLSNLSRFELLIQCGFRGIGRGNGWVHVDVREEFALWRYAGRTWTRDDDTWEALHSLKNKGRLANLIKREKNREA